MTTPDLTKTLYKTLTKGLNTMETNPKELTLKHVNVLFAELVDKGYGRNITIDVTAPAILNAITTWSNANGIKLKVKDYTDKKTGKVTKQYQLKLTDFTQVEGKNGETEQALGYGAVVNLVARAFDYDNKFGKGKSASLSAIFIVEPAKNNTMAKIAE